MDYIQTLNKKFGSGMKSGAIWDLSNEEKKKYVEDKKSGKNQIDYGSWKGWDKEKAMKEKK